MEDSKITDWLREIIRPIVENSVKSALSDLAIFDNEAVPSDFLNAEEAAEFLQLSIHTLYGKTSKREIPHTKRGKKLLFKRSELEQWIDQGRISTQEELQQQAVDRMRRRRPSTTL